MAWYVPGEVLVLLACTVVPVVGLVLVALLVREPRQVRPRMTKAPALRGGRGRHRRPRGAGPAGKGIRAVYVQAPFVMDAAVATAGVLAACQSVRR